jgi:hypothetical protein
MPRLHFVTGIACLGLLASGCATKRNPAARDLPPPLVNALLNQGFDETQGLEFTVDTLPTGFPAALRPSGAKAVGGMRTVGHLVAIFADSSRPLAPIIETLLEAQGFRRPPPPPASGFSSGFGAGPYCSDGNMVSVMQLSGASRHLARVDYRTVPGYSCAQFERRPSRSELKLPGLTAPPGVHVSSSGGGSGSDGVNSRAAMTGTRLVPSAILKHYSDQLVAAGWTAAAPAISERVAAQFFEAMTPEGDRWNGVLMVVGGGSNAQLSLVMRKP